MTQSVVHIGDFQLALALLFIAVAAAASLFYRLRLERDLFLGTLRTFLQLFLMGYALTFIFKFSNPLLVLSIYVMMISFAAWIVRGRIREKAVSFFPPTLLSMLVGYLLVTALVTGVVVRSDPWWHPQYFIPIGGMVVGNSMTAIALTLERLFSELRSRRDEVEMRLALGADYREASADTFRNALKAGMMPSINSMMGVGIVFIPGMMTGQILAGADPLVSIRYQIVVMLMLVGSTAVSSFIVTGLVRRRCFGAAHELLLRPDVNGKS